MPDPPGEGLTVNIYQQQEPTSVSDVKDQSASDDKLTLRMSLRKDS
jgi:hypothetical protein